MKGLHSYLGLGKSYLIQSKSFQIGIDIGKFPEINSEKLRIGNFLDPELSVKGRGKGVGVGKVGG